MSDAAERLRQLRLPLVMPPSRYIPTIYGPRTVQLASADDVVTHNHGLREECDRRCPTFWRDAEAER